MGDRKPSYGRNAAGMLGGAIAGAIVNAGVNAGVNWNNERKARKAIARLFREHCTEDDGRIRQYGKPVEVANLVFTVDSNLQKDWGAGHYSVQVVNTTLPGDDPKRVRTFGYFADGGIAWPPLYLYVTQDKYEGARQAKVKAFDTNQKRD